MSKQIEPTRIGLAAIKSLLSRDPCIHANTAIQMIDAMLAEQPAQQEPLVTKNKSGITLHVGWDDLPVGTKLYTSPQAQPAREWVGLTDEEIEQGCKESWVTLQAWQSAVWWAEDKLKEKNT